MRPDDLVVPTPTAPRILLSPKETADFLGMSAVTLMKLVITGCVKPPEYENRRARFGPEWILWFRCHGAALPGTYCEIPAGHGTMEQIVASISDGHPLFPQVRKPVRKPVRKKGGGK